MVNWRKGPRRCRFPKQVQLKDPSKFKIIGKPVKRLDTPEKTNGKGIFGIDVEIPGMLVALVARPPVFGGKLKSFKADKAEAVPGVQEVVAGSIRSCCGCDRLLGGKRAGTRSKSSGTKDPTLSFRQKPCLNSMRTLPKRLGRSQKRRVILDKPCPKPPNKSVRSTKCPTSHTQPWSL